MSAYFASVGFGIRHLPIRSALKNLVERQSSVLKSAGSADKIYAAVVELGEVVWQDPDAQPAPWWSLSKTAIASAALVLVQEGRLELDNPIVGGDYSLRQLLQHTAGLPDYGGLTEYHQSVASGILPWSQQELFDRVEVQRTRSIPGEQFAYSNIGYLMVRNLIEKEMDLPLGHALNALVFRPLDLDGVRIASIPSDLQNCMWSGSAGYHPGWVFHGLAVGTPAQAALFLDRLLNGRLLGEKLIEAMRQPFIIADHSVPNRPWNSGGYGLGLMIDRRSPMGPCYGHTGSGPGSATATYRFEALLKTQTVSVFSNVENEGKVEADAIALANGSVP